MNSDDIIKNTMDWLLNSDIRIKHGEEKGALYGWKDLTTSSYTFIYSEIVGYALTCFANNYIENFDQQSLNAAIEGSSWIIKNMRSNVLTAGKPNETKAFNSKGDLSNQIYSFDNGMILIGLLNLYKANKDPEVLQSSITIADALIDNFFDGIKMTALLDNQFKSSDYGKNKWSTMSGSFQAKIAIGFLKLFKITQKTIYKEVAYALCDFALNKQDKNGRFKTNMEDNLTFLHPHLYSCEGLLYSGLELSEDRYVESAIKGIEWAVKQIDNNNNNNGILPRTTEEHVEQSDCIAQLTRLMIICYKDLKKRDLQNIDIIIDSLAKSLLSLYISDKDIGGGIKYQQTTNQICTWCTMFAWQAFRFYKGLKNENDLSMIEMMEYYI